MTTFLGNPCWFELSTSDLTAAKQFYSNLLGWTIADSGMPDMTYELASTANGNVAGMMALDDMPDGTPPNWLVYIGADDLEDTIGKALAAGAGSVVEPTEVPGTGRFAVIRDPQSAVVGLLEPLPSGGGDADDGAVGPYDQSHTGHCGWIELATVGPDTALNTYGDVFGWTAGDTFDMDDGNTYHLFAREGTNIGGMGALGAAPTPHWTPFFNVASAEQAVDSILKGGGQVVHGPAQVPGGKYIAYAIDPQGAHFAVIGAK